MEILYGVLVVLFILCVVTFVAMCRDHKKLIEFLQDNSTRWFTTESLARESKISRPAVRGFMLYHCKANSVFYRLAESEILKLHYDEREILKLERPNKDNIMFFEFRFANPYVLGLKGRLPRRPGSSA